MLPDGATVAELKEKVARDYPGVRETLANLVVAVNQNYAFDSDPVPDGARWRSSHPSAAGETGQRS